MALIARLTADLAACQEALEYILSPVCAWAREERDAARALLARLKP